jgi:hypothetical protein
MNNIYIKSKKIKKIIMELISMMKTNRRKKFLEKVC